ncbi:HAD hydrolase-like protein [Ructibacterium gallinarum]|uniref:HAD hydrolase-like protein n=1 Tax=Ructibacterium gallinarum TaxID=2779355 RepID=A0A9D5R7Y2_9FIRM|nr:HAD hydrolase-like protein [Ructibacterium gallinarum]MBE5039372.1 HAD hydrolase-like protein [Ructibacterium gallinarum]
MYQYLLFDLDGTLTDPKEGITKSFQYALRHCGIEEKLENLNRVIGPPLIDSFCEFYGMDMKQAKFAVEKYRERFAQTGIYENKLYPGVEEMLDELKHVGKKVALATSKPLIFASEILRNFNIDSYFDVVMGSELDGSRSKKAEVIKEVFRQFSDPPLEEGLMIGDRRQDIAGAVEFGVASLGVRFGYAEPGELEEAGADFLVNTVEELRRFLLAH